MRPQETVVSQHKTTHHASWVKTACNPADPISTNPLCNISELEFRVEMLRVLKDIKKKNIGVPVNNRCI